MILTSLTALLQKKSGLLVDREDRHSTDFRVATDHLSRNHT